MNRILHSGLACALIIGALAFSPAARAQGVPGTGTNGFRPVTKPQALPKDPDAGPPPPALPGAVSTTQPAEKTQLDLPPTEALFDAINRGDIASARDALSRGADLNGRNVLGMTPIDLSVDLSRNDITFLLLSMRGSAPPIRVAAQPGAASGKAETRMAAKAAQAKAIKLAMHAKPRPVLAAAPAPRQYAGQSDPGVPNLQAGFLGFGPGAVQ